MNPVLMKASMWRIHLKTTCRETVFFSELQLSFPVDIIRYCPGGSIITTVSLVHVAPNRTEAQFLTQGARMVQKLKPHLREYHTRGQKNAFKMKLKNIAKIHC